MTQRRFNIVRVKPKWPDFPAWFVICCGIIVIALSLPLAIKVGLAGSFDFACPSRSRSSHDLASRNWLSFSGWAAYLHSAAWLSIALSGLFLVIKTKQREILVIWFGIVGFVCLVFTFWVVC